MDGDQEIEATEAIAGTVDEPARYAQLLRDQAVTIAHYKKMYDRSSALARIGVWECELATERLTWTDGVYDLFELPRGTAVDRPEIVAMYDEDSRREMERMRAEAIRDGSGFTLDIRIRTARGNDRWLRLSADIEQDVAGNAVRIFGTKQDITRERAAQDAVQSLQAELIHLSRRSAMSAMAATLAHELNQPLTAISNYVAGTRRALADPAAPGDVLTQGLDAIERCAFGAGDIIRSLRKMTSENPSERRPVDPNGLLREAAALTMVGTSGGVRLRYEVAEGLAVCVDPIQIQQVFINLIRNALDAVQESPNGEILISTALAGDEIEIRIDDNGPGVAPEIMDTLFDPFVSTKAGGMGIGLSVSRTIADAHGGRITAENRPGGGASFRVELPRTDEAAGVAS